jgi:hypothetical protein
MQSLVLCLSTWCLTAVAYAEDNASFLLQSELKPGDSWTASVKLQVGGDLLVREAEDESKEEKEKKLPLTVTGEMRYEERLLGWSQDKVARSLRHYHSATAKIQVDEGGIERNLSDDCKQMVVEIRDNRSAINGRENPLTRQQLDLVNVAGNTLALQRLLPGRSLVEGESWDHSITAIGPLLGLDYVAVCEVSSVVVGFTNGYVQIRLAGTVHGTIDGAPTEMELVGAYLFHTKRKRITKFNLAIKEHRTASDIVPGLDVVAKVTIVLTPAAETGAFTAKQIEQAGDLSQPLNQNLLFEAQAQGYRFEHGIDWYVTAEQSELVSLRSMHDGELLAHCNVTTLPARSEGNFTSLEQFERDIRTALGENLESVVAATSWTTARGCHCLGIVAQGKVEDVSIEWRYYLVSAADLPRVSLAVTVEQSRLKQFDDADRQLVETLELLPKPSPSTAGKGVGARR